MYTRSGATHVYICNTHVHRNYVQQQTPGENNEHIPQLPLEHQSEQFFFFHPCKLTVSSHVPVL